MVMIDSVDADSVLEQLLLAELQIDEKRTFSKVAALTHGTMLLTFLDSNSNTLSAADAIAFRLGADVEAVEAGLSGLLRLGLVRRLDVGPRLWGLTENPTRRQTVKNLVAWQNRWRVRLAQLDRVVRGVPFEGNGEGCPGNVEGCPDNADCSRCSSFLIAAINTLQAAA